MKRFLFLGLCLFTCVLGVQAEEYSEEFQKVAPNGIATINSIKPLTPAEQDFYLNSHIVTTLNDSNVYAFMENCNDSLTECDLSLGYFGEGEPEKHRVQFVWKETDVKVKQLIDKYIEKLESMREDIGDSSNGGRIDFVVNDLNLVNYYSHVQDDNVHNEINKIVNYSSDLKNIFENGNITYYLDMRAGSMEPMSEYGFGGFTIYYNGVIYGLVDCVGIRQQAVIYVPDDTDDTSDAYIEAAKARIDEYLGHYDAIVEVGGERDSYVSEYGDSIDFSILGDEDKMGAYYYNITVGNVTKPFVIIRDSSKIKEVEYKTRDMSTDINITSSSSEVPLDTTIKVEVIEKGSQTFNDIVSKLNVKEAFIYDLKLYSEIWDKYITKLENGSFYVNLPINEELKNKELIVYYINDSGDIEKHTVEVVDGYARFITNHFSIYSMVANDVYGELPPKTVDSVSSYLLFMLFGLFGVIFTSIKYRQIKN